MRLPLHQKHLDTLVAIANNDTTLPDVRQTLAEIAVAINVSIAVNDAEQLKLALDRTEPELEFTERHAYLMDRVLTLGIMANGDAGVFSSDEVMKVVEGMQILHRELRENARELDCSDCDDPTDPCCRTVAPQDLSTADTGEFAVEFESANEAVDFDGGDAESDARFILDAVFSQLREVSRNDGRVQFTLQHLSNKLEAFFDKVITANDFTDTDIKLLTAVLRDAEEVLIPNGNSEEDQKEMLEDLSLVRAVLMEKFGREI